MTCVKYELTDITIEHEGKTLHRIRALKDFGRIKKGALGGFIESEHNLSQEGECWIYGIAKVYDDANISGNAVVTADAKVYGNAKVCDDARISGNAKVYDDAVVCDRGRVYGKASVSYYSKIFENGCVSGHACLDGRSDVSRVGKDESVYEPGFVKKLASEVLYPNIINWLSSK